MSNLRASLLRILLAVGFSFALWAFVSFSQNPEATVTFPAVPLEAVGLAQGLVIVDATGMPTQSLPPVDITLSTDQRQLTQLRPVDVRAVADLSGRGPGEHNVPVNVQPTRSNLSFSVPEGGVEPSALTIRLEAVSTKLVPISLELRGNLPFSFERGEPTISFGGQPISAMEVEGPQSRVNRVVSAMTMANIEQLRATYLAPLTLTPVDGGGQPVEGLSVSPATVTVEIPINPVVGLKLVPVEPEIVGLPAPGFEVTGVSVEPPLIALAGSSGPLDAVDVLTTAPINLAGARQSIVRSVAIIFPDGTSPREGEPDAVRVTVQIAALALPFQVTLPAPVILTGLGGGLQFGVTPQVVTTTLTGTSAALVGLGQAQLRATVDVSGLGPGTYDLPVSVALPPGVSLVGDPQRVQVTLRLPPAPTATPVAPTPTGSPAPTGSPGPTDTPERPTETVEPPASTPTAPPEPPTPTPEPTATP